MKAISIIALIFASIAMLIPVGGPYIAIFCSLLAMISFRWEPTLSGITFGINILNTAFLSPSLVVAGAAVKAAPAITTSATALQAGLNGVDPNAATAVTSAAAAGDKPSLYAIFIGLHIAAFVVAVLIRLIAGSPKNKEAT